MWKNLFADQSTNCLDQLIEQVEALSSEIEKESDHIESDLERMEQIATLIRQGQSEGDDIRYLALSPFMALVNRILDDKYEREASEALTDSRLESISSSLRPIYPVLTDIHIFYSERMLLWPEQSRFLLDDGLAGRALDYSFDRSIWVEESLNEDVDSYLESCERGDVVRKMGSSIHAMILDCEGLASRRDIEPLGAEHVFAYIAAMASADEICANEFPDHVWTELQDSVSHAAGAERLGLISRFVSEFGEVCGIDIVDQFSDMQKSFMREILTRVVAASDPATFYKGCILAAEGFWVDAVRFEQQQDNGCKG